MLKEDYRPKRKQPMWLRTKDGQWVPVRYKNKHGFTRPNYINVYMPDGKVALVYRQELFLEKEGDG